MAQTTKMPQTVSAWRSKLKAVAEQHHVGHPAASCEQSGRSEQKARAGIGLLLQVVPRNSKRYSRLDRVKLLSIPPIVGDEACVVVDWAGFGNYTRQRLYT
jgi:hypothetical protein